DYVLLFFSGSQPRQPVTITLPFSLSALPMAASDSAWALSRKPQVLTTARSAPAFERASSYPSARSRVMMRSLSTSALWQPSETKLTLGARSRAGFSMAEGLAQGRGGGKRAAVVRTSGRGRRHSPSLNVHDRGLHEGCRSRPSC